MEGGFDYGPDGPKRTVVCPTDGCINQGLPIVVPDDGSGVVCGPCGADITATSSSH